jgi:predicted outer membrane repeat protein
MKHRYCVVTLLFMLAAVSAGSTEYVVDLDGFHDFTAIGPAVQAAANGDTVIVNPGTYTGSLNKNIMVVAKNLVIRSSSGPFDTIIDCEGAGRAFYVSNAAIDSTMLLWGFTITHGWARGATEDGAGAIVCDYAAPVIENCFFIENEGNFGGAVKFLYGDAIMRSCLFKGNEAVCAGALHLTTCSPTISRCTFIGNSATGSGGAFRTFKGNPVFRNCTFAGNSSASGGCLQFDSSPVAGTIDRCIIAFGTRWAVLGGSGVTTTHSVIYGNALGDSLTGTTHHDNAFVDPLFCDMDDSEFTVCANSVALAANNPWGVDVGVEGQNCPDCASPVAAASWGAIKALFGK